MYSRLCKALRSDWISAFLGGAVTVALCWPLLSMADGSVANGMNSGLTEEYTTTGYEKYQSYALRKGRRPKLPSFRQMARAPRARDHVLVRLKDNESAAALLDIGVRSERRWRSMGQLRRMRVPLDVSMEEILERLNAHPAVDYAEPDYRIELAVLPNDPGASGVYHWQQINASRGWNYATDARGIGPIAIFDTGIEHNHQDLRANMWTNPGEIPGNGIDDDGNGYIDDTHGAVFNNYVGAHGTHVSGLVCARGNNNKGVTGTSWSCDLMDVKSVGFLSDTVASVVTGMDYALANGARLSNHSWRVFNYSQALADVVDTAEQAGHLMVVAAGNENVDIESEPCYPCSLPNDNIITVAASNRSGARAGFSSYGRISVDLAAPGDAIYSAFTNGGYAYMSGTSMATPIVTGAAGLLWAQRPHWDYLQVKTHLLNNVRRTGKWNGLTVTGGILDLGRVMSNLVTNRKPALDNPGGQMDKVGDSVGLQLVASDPDGDSLSFSATGLPAGLDVDAVTGLIDGVPTRAGSFTCEVRVDDDRGGFMRKAFQWVIEPVGAGGSGVNLSVADVTTDENGDYAYVAISLSKKTNKKVSFDIATVAGSATAGEDYIARFGERSIAAGRLKNTIWIPLVNDASAEGDESFRLVISNPINATIADGSGDITIVDDDTAGVGAPQLSVADVVVDESGGHALFEVSLSRPSNKAVIFSIATEDETAVGGSDYITRNGNRAIKAGKTKRTIYIPLVDDAAGEDDETFRLVLSNAHNADIGDGVATATVLDNDGNGGDRNRVDIQVSDVTVRENGGYAKFMVSLSRPSTVDVRFHVQTVNGTALKSDYRSKRGYRVIEAGATERPFFVAITNDKRKEATESFLVRISEVENADVVDGEGRGTILDND